MHKSPPKILKQKNNSESSVATEAIFASTKLEGMRLGCIRNSQINFKFLVSGRCIPLLPMDQESVDDGV